MNEKGKNKEKKMNGIEKKGEKKKKNKMNTESKK